MIDSCGTVHTYAHSNNLEWYKKLGMHIRCESHSYKIFIHVYTCIYQSETCPFDRFNSSWPLTRERMSLNLKEKSFADIKEIPRERGIGIWSFLLGIRVGHMFSVVN